MSYSITLSNGSTLTSVADSTADTTSTSLTLLGRLYPGYSKKISENFVHVLENFSNVSSPSNPLTGQLWYDSTNQILKLWNGVTWSNIGSADGTVPEVVLNNPLCPTNQRKWKIRVSNDSPYIGMLVVEALNDDGSVKNTVMALDGVNNIILGAVTYS